MKNHEFLVYEYGETKNADLYEFLATNYDISDLAGKICAAKYLKINTINLKKSSSDIA